MPYYILIALISIPLSYLIASKTKEEYKENKNYFNILIISLFSIIAFYTFNITNFLFILLGIVIAFLLNKPYLSLGFALLTSFIIGKELLITSLVFITSLLLSITYFNEKHKLRNFIINVILISTPSALIATNINFQPLTTGLLIGSLFKVFKDVVFSKPWIKPR